MVKNIKRIYIEKKKGFDVEGQNLFADLKENLGIKNLKSVRVINRCDVEGLSDEELETAKKDSVFPTSCR